MASVQSSATEDPHLGAGPDEDGSEVSLSGSETDPESVLSDDSVLPEYQRERKRGPSFMLYKACSRNEAQTLKLVLERGVTKEEVMETDINGRVRFSSLILEVFERFQVLYLRE